MKAIIQTGQRNLARQKFQTPAEVPLEDEWFANIRNPITKRAYL
jgi:hypothetical protein